MELPGYKKIETTQLNENLVKLIALDWMLVTAGDKEKFNTMTANWGGAGYLWNKPVVFIFVRPERYTFKFTEKCDLFTLSFFEEKYRKSLNICGSKSGRDCNKVAEASLTPCFTELGNPTFTEARIVMECRKLYTDMLTADSFIDKSILNTFYTGKGGLHKIYIAEIVNVWQK
jgi:flavin reductase (DIM6/NTAB) family NADH-FMN oxidoreductase RutF